MLITKTDRGFKKCQFLDHYRSLCSLQQSSLATEECVWLGCAEGTRMHLTRGMVRELLPHLQAFVETGDIEV